MKLRMVGKQEMWLRIHTANKKKREVQSSSNPFCLGLPGYVTKNTLTDYFWYYWLLSVDVEKLENYKRCILILSGYNKYPLTLGLPKYCF